MNKGKFWDIDSQEYKDEVARIEKEAFAEGYARAREEQYAKVGDALDAIYKYFNYRRMQGDELTQELDNWVNSCTQVKRNNPKPVEEGVQDDTI